MISTKELKTLIDKGIKLMVFEIQLKHWSSQLSLEQWRIVNLGVRVEELHKKSINRNSLNRII